MTSDQLILALDVDTAKEALQWAHRLKSRVGTFKVGLQLYLRGGSEVLSGLQKLEVPIFLDLKFHDIPNTVGQAVAAVAHWRPRFLTVHASGGQGMMQAAVAAPATDPAKNLTRPMRDDLSQVRALALLGFFGRTADIEEACEFFMRSKSKGIFDCWAVGDPLGNPARAEAKRIGGETSIVTGCPRRQHLLPFGRSAGLQR